MTQELIYTSVPRGLAPDSSGFCTVACTEKMHPHAERALVELSGYRHLFLPGDDNAAFNPVSLLHAIRRVGGNDLHILSRISDCEADYTGRSNLIAHHIALGQNELPACGPAAMFLQSGVFKTSWQGEPHYLPPKILPNLSAAPQKCIAWERVVGDAGWGGVVAEAAEAGHPISLIFEPGMELMPLISETLALLPEKVRWRVTFSTFFMKSQEPPSANKIQIKCILADSPEMAFSRLTPKTLCLDLRQPLGSIPSEYAKYVGAARTGKVSQQTTQQTSTPTKQLDAELARLDAALAQTPGHIAVPGAVGGAYDIQAGQTSVPLPLGGLSVPKVKKRTEMLSREKSSWWVYLIPLLVIGIVVPVVIFHKPLLKPVAQPSKTEPQQEVVPAPEPEQEPEAEQTED